MQTPLRVAQLFDQTVLTVIMCYGLSTALDIRLLLEQY